MNFKQLAISALIIRSIQINFASAQITNIPGLVRYHTGDGTLEDLSATGIDINVYQGTTITGAAQYETVNTVPFSSQPRSVFKLDGSNSKGYHLRSSTDGLPVGDAPRTIMGWVRIDQTTTDWPTMFGYGGPSTRHMFDFVTKSNGTVELDIWGSGDEALHAIFNYSNALGVWVHYAITYESPTVKAYVNGVLAKQGAITGGPLTTLSEGFMIGGRVTQSTVTFYGAAAEVAVFNRALTASEINTAFSTDTAGGGGDPHFFAFGGIFFSWMGQCDLVLIKAAKTNIEVHIRSRRVRRWSAIDTIAFKTGNDKGEIRSDDGSFRLNGNEIESINTKALSVVKSSHTSKKNTLIYSIVFHGDKKLDVEVNTRTEMIYVNLSGNYEQGTVGLLGSPHNPGLFARNGTKMSNEVINKFVESWQVQDTDPQLFHERRKPQFPEQCIYHVTTQTFKRHSRHLKEKPQVSMDEAILACAPHRAGPLREGCIYDVINTGDLETAEDSFYG